MRDRVTISDFTYLYPLLYRIGWLFLQNQYIVLSPMNANMHISIQHLHRVGSHYSSYIFKSKKLQVWVDAMGFLFLVQSNLVKLKPRPSKFLP